jgi:magnesium-protoporphyrin O-methyltransferase
VQALMLRQMRMKLEVQIARERLPADVDPSLIDFRSGDMLSAELGYFDHVVAMDSMIHYERHDMVAGLARLAERTSASIVFTFAPSNPVLAAMIKIGRMFPRGDRAPFIEPVSESALRDVIAAHQDLTQWQVGRTEKISSGFYTSQAMELRT